MNEVLHAVHMPRRLMRSQKPHHCSSGAPTRSLAHRLQVCAKCRRLWLLKYKLVEASSLQRIYSLHNPWSRSHFWLRCGTKALVSLQHHCIVGNAAVQSRGISGHSLLPCPAGFWPDTHCATAAILSSNHHPCSSHSRRLACVHHCRHEALFLHHQLGALLLQRLACQGLCIVTICLCRVCRAPGRPK